MLTLLLVLFLIAYPLTVAWWGRKVRTAVNREWYVRVGEAIASTEREFSGTMLNVALAHLRRQL